VAEDFHGTLGSWQHFTYFVRNGLVKLIELSDGDVVTLGDTLIRPSRLA